MFAQQSRSKHSVTFATFLDKLSRRAYIRDLSRNVANVARPSRPVWRACRWRQWRASRENEAMSSTKTYVVSLAPLFVCEACWKPVRNGGGYLCVNKEAAAQLMGSAGHKVNWHIYHELCDIDHTVTDYLIWTRKFHDTNDLFLEMAYLEERMPWFQTTNWTGLIRRVIADTNRYGQERCGSRDGRDPELTKLRRKKYLKQMQANPNDKRHGTITGYNNIGCRCEKCREASSEHQRKHNGHSDAS